MTTPTDVLFSGLTGSDFEFQFPFEYLDKADVRVFLNEAPVDPVVYEVDGNTVRWKGQPYPIGDLLSARFTDITKKEVDYVKTSALRTADLNRQNDQFIFALQELTNRGGSGGGGVIPGYPGGSTGPVIEDPTGEGPLIDFIDGMIAEYDVIIQAALANLEGQINAFDQAATTLSEDVAGWQALLDQYTAGFEGRINTVEIENDEIAALVSQVQTQTEETAATVRLLQLTTVEGQASLVTQLDSRVGDLESSLTDVLNVQGDLAQRIGSLESSDGVNASLIQTLQQTTADQALQISNQQTLVDGVTSQIGSLQLTTDTLASDLQTLSVSTGEFDNRVSTLETATDSVANRVSNVESSTGDISARVTTLEQTSASGNAVAIQQLQTDVDDLQNSVTNVQATTTSNASQISQLTSQGNNFSSRIGTLETTSNGLASSVSALNSRVGAAEADVTQIAQVAAAADGKASGIFGVTVNSNGNISGFKLSNNGTRSDFVIQSSTFRIERPGTSPKQIFSVNTSTGVVKMPGVEVDTLSANSIETENLVVGSVSETVSDSRSGVGIPSNQSWVRVHNFNFNKARGGFYRFDFSTDIQYNSGVEAGIEVKLEINGVYRTSFFFKPATYFKSTWTGSYVGLQSNGNCNVEVFVKASNTQGGISGMSVARSVAIIQDLKA